ncbi:MAG TPA: FIST N-terminal domain-containing protein, partial [Longimicrobium sp.]|nr:FIST N-terminal domain-containing protein [Longimicrobium sp.]
QTVAIKVLLTQNWDANTAEVAKALANLRSEARSSIKLTHPNIIRAYNYERDASWEFMVMEFVEGEDLRKYRKRLPGKILPTDEVIRIGIAALNGLEHAHSVGIIHYDIKPANILLTSQKEIKLCDFGLSVLTALGATDQVQPRDNELMVIGTPGYVSPEMIVNGKADHRTDLYAMAATLFDLCSGAPPFGHSSEQAFYGHVRLPIPDIANLRRPLMDVIRRGLDKNPEIRFQSAAAMRAALEAAAEAMRKEATAETAVGPKPRVAEDAPRAEERPATPAPRAAAVAPRAAAVAPRAEPAPAADDGIQVSTLSYSLDKKAWSAPFPPLDSERTLVLAFGAPELLDHPAPIAELAQAFPHSQVIGCSTAGEIIGTEVRDRSLSVSVVRFARTHLASATVQVTDPNQSFSAGEALARKLNRQGLRAVFVLSEGLKVNGSELVRGFNSVLGTGVTVTGGLSGDGSRFQRTWVISGGKVQPGLVCAVGLYGEHLRIAHGSKGGWDVFGPERRVTRSEGNVLHELDGKPALALYKQYLGDKADGLPATGLLFPLALRLPGEKDKVLVRTLLAVDAVKNSMTFAGDIPKGSTVQLMKANFDRLIGGASSAALMAKELLQDNKVQPQSLAIAISCVGRRLVLGDRTDEEIEAVRDVLPQGTRISGFYSYGELSPYASGSCDLHNQTMTLTFLSEKPSQAARPAAASTAAASTTAGAAARKPQSLAPPLPPPSPSASMGPEDTRPHVLPNGVAKPKQPVPLGTEPAGPTERAATRPHVPSPFHDGVQVMTLWYSIDKKVWSAPFPPLDSERTLVLAFGAPELIDQPGPIAELAQAFPNSQVIGCSTAGDIIGTEVRDRSLSVSIIRFARTNLASATVQVADPNQSFSAGEALARKLNRQGLRAVFVLSEGLKVNGSELVRGFNSVLGTGVTVTGG